MGQGAACSASASGVHFAELAPLVADALHGRACTSPRSAWRRRRVMPRSCSRPSCTPKAQPWMDTDCPRLQASSMTVLTATLTTCSVTLSSHSASARSDSGRPLEQHAVAVAHVLDVADPVVGQCRCARPRAPPGRRRSRSGPTTMMCSHLEPLDRELDRRQRVEVGVHDDVRHVAMHEHLARLQPGDLVGGHAAVGAADPHVLGRLLLHQAGEEAGAIALHPRSPAAVVGEQVIEVVWHGVVHCR